MNPILALLLTTMAKGTELEPGVSALVKLSSGLALVEADHTAIGRAMELAHRRMDAGKNPNPLPPSARADPLQPPGGLVGGATSGPTLPAGVVINRGNVG